MTTEKNFQFIFESNNEILSGDTIEIYFPYISFNQLNFMLTLNSDIFVTTWDSSSSLISISIDRNILSAQQNVFTANCAFTYVQGISEESYSKISWIRNTLVLFQTEVLLVCSGICQIFIEPYFSKAGFVMPYTFVAKLSSPMVPGDSISIKLNGFSSSISSSTIIDTLTGNFSVSWDSLNSNLIITSLGDSSSLLNFTIPNSLSLRVPRHGIRSNDFRDATYVTSSGFSLPYVNVTTIKPVGSFQNVSLYFNPLRPSSPISISLNLIVRNVLSSGDDIEIYLPNFIVPNHSIYMNDSITGYELNVLGVPSSVDVGLNADGSTYSTIHESKIVIKVLSNILAYMPLNIFIPIDFGIISSAIGTYRNNTPTIAIDSITSPIATTIISNMTAFGSLSPSEANFSFALSPMSPLNNKLELIYVSFNIECPLMINDSIIITLPNVVLNDSDLSNHLVVHNIRNESSFAAKWIQSHYSLYVKLLKSNVRLLFGHLSFIVDVRSNNATISNMVMLLDDSRYEYSVSSIICPIQSKSFTMSPSTLIISSFITFSNPRAGETSIVFFGLKTSFNLFANDVIELRLPEISPECNGYLSSGSYFTSNYSNSLFRILVTSDYLKLQDIIIPLGDISCGLIIPHHGINKKYISSYSIIRESHAIAIGQIQRVQLVGYILNSSFVPLMGSSGHAIEFSISISLSVELAVGDVIRISLPGFTSTSSQISHNISSILIITWDALTSSLICVASMHIEPMTRISFVIPLSTKLISPLSGIPFGFKDFTISTNSSLGPILPTPFQYVATLPSILESTISFISSDSDYSVEVDGDDLALELIPGHDLNEADVGSTFDLYNNRYLIQQLKDNVVHLSPHYSDQNIYNGNPIAFMKSSSSRPAMYLHGSGGDELVFRYIVRRGDSFNSIEMQDPLQDSLLTNTLDLNGGKIYRLEYITEIKQEVPMNILIPYPFPSLLIDSTKVISSQIPRVVHLFTTTQNGTYALGDMLDFHITFDFPVISKYSMSSPLLQLTISPGELRIAHYSSGFGTNILVFVYSVLESDFQLHRSSELLDATKIVNSSFFQPLRIIPYSIEDYLRRLSDRPTIDVSLIIPLNLSYEFPKDIGIIGKAAKVIDISISSSVGPSGYYSAGDTLELKVSFSSFVNIQESYTGHYPYILLESGSMIPIIAKFQNATLKETKDLYFSYEFQITDSLEHGLCLLANSSNYFNRIFIELNGSRILTSVNGNLIDASIILSPSSQTSLRCIDEHFVLDNTAPMITQVLANISSDSIVYAAGTSLEIQLKFSSPVVVEGFIKLILKGEQDNCEAYYINGNNSNYLYFLYLTSSGSCVSKLDFIDINSLDMSHGRILKLSSKPQIEVDIHHFYRGSYGTLGITSNIAVDTTSSNIQRMSTVSNSNAILVTTAIDMVIHRGYLAIAIRELSDMFSKDILVNSLQRNTTLNNHILQDNFLDPISVVWRNMNRINNINSTHVIIEDANMYPFVSIPTLYDSSIDNRIIHSSQSFWWSSYLIQNHLDFGFIFDRFVNLQNLYVNLSTGHILNQAFLTPNALNEFYLIIDRIPGLNIFTSNITSDVLDITIVSNFQFKYGSLLSNCVTVNALSTGVDSIFNALQSINTLLILSPWIDLVAVSFNGLRSEYKITFQRPLTDTFQIYDGQGYCVNPIKEDQVRMKASEVTRFRYPIRYTSSIVLEANSDIAIGIYTFSFLANPGVLGVGDGSILLERFDNYGRLLTSLHVPSNSIPSITWSSLEFSSSIPFTSTDVLMSICILNGFNYGDIIEVSLPDFQFHNLSANISSIINTQTNIIRWSIQDNATTCATQTIPHSFVILPSYALYPGNSQMLNYNLLLSNSRIYNNTFLQVSNVGLNDISISFTNPHPGEPTNFHITFSLIHSLIAFESVLLIHLPTFTTSKSCYEVILLTVRGNMSLHFIAYWSIDYESTIEIIPIHYIQPDKYSLIISSAKTCSSIYMSTIGVSMNNPPSFSFISSSYNISNTIIDDFPRILGFDNSLFVFNISMNQSISNIHFKANFIQDLIGKVVIVLKIPFFISDYLERSFLLLGFQATWYLMNQSIVLISNDSFQSRDIDIEISDLTFLKMNEFNTSSTVEVSCISSNAKVIGITVAKVISQGFIVSSSLEFTSLIEKSYVSSHLVNISISVQVSNTITALDVFEFYLPGISLASSFTNSNVTIIGNCLEPQGTFQNSILRVITSADPLCRNGISQIDLFIPSSNGFMRPQVVNQFNQNQFLVSWYSRDFNWINIPFMRFPIIGFTSSSLVIDNPNAGGVSNVALKLLLVEILQAGDNIIVYFKGIQFTWSNVNLLDSYGMSWLASIHANHLILTSTMMTPASNIKFTLSSHLAPRISLDGMVSANITLSNDKTILYPQPIAFITSIGRIIEGEVILVNSSDQLTLRVIIETNHKLEVGDEITLEFQQYFFSSDRDLVISDSSVSAKSYAASRSIVLSILNDNSSNTLLDLQIHGQFASIDFNYCDSLYQRCPLNLSILSSTCPISSYIIYPKFVGLLFNTSMKVFESNGNITFDISFTTLTSMQPNTTIFISILDSLLNSSYSNTYELVSSNSFVTSIWNGYDQRIELSFMKTIPSGYLQLEMTSYMLSLNQIIVYQDDPSLNYAMSYQGDILCSNNVFDYISIPGVLVESSSFSFGIIQDMSYLTFQVLIELMNPLSSNDKIVLHLPGFQSNESSIEIVSSFDVSSSAIWDNSSKLLTVDLLSNISHIEFTIIKSLQFPINVFEDSRSIDPMISIQRNGVSTHARTFLKLETPGQFVYSKLSYSYPVAPGRASTLHFQVFFTQGFNSLDTLSIYLPQFVQTNERILASSLLSTSFGEFMIRWNQCSHILQLQAMGKIPIGMLNISFDGFMLPIGGIDRVLSSNINILTNISGSSLSWTSFQDVQLVNNIIYSNISYRPYGNYSMELQFVIASEILENDTISIDLPSFVITFPEGDVNIAVILPYILNKNASTNATIHWNKIQSMLQIVFLNPIPGNTLFKLLIPGILQLPSEGITECPVLDLMSFNGNVDAFEISSCDQIGFHQTSILYDFIDVSKSVEMTIQFQLLGVVIKEFDVIYIRADAINCVHSTLICSGQFAGDNFACPFEVTFYSSNKTLALRANKPIDSIPIAIRLLYVNRITFDRDALSTNQVNHSVWGSFREIGNLRAISIPSFPENLGDISVLNSVSISDCRFASNSFCSFEVSLNIYRAIPKGHLVAIGHSTWDISNDIVSSTLISGNATQYFSASIRERDNEEVYCSSKEISGFPMEESFGYADADFPQSLVNLTIPESFHNVPIATIVTTVPRIISIYATTSLDSLYCDDFIIIAITFSEAVMILDPTNTKLFLNTYEYANYLDGNMTTSIRMFYRVTKKSVETINLSVIGPHALEYYSKPSITRLNQPSSYANVTFSEPFGDLLKMNVGISKPISVSCQLYANIINVSIYNALYKPKYSIGDNVDFLLTFDRMISAHGFPKLMLFDKLNHSRRAIATYTNVSYNQWIDVYGPQGQISLAYDTSISSCVDWNDSVGLQYSISNISSIQESLPLSIDVYAIPNGYRYRLQFFGSVAPKLLRIVTLFCESDSRSSIFMDPSMLSRAVMRYSVEIGDCFQELTISGYDAISTDNQNYFSIIDHEIWPPQINKTLPFLLTQIGNNDTSNSESKYISISSEIPRVMQVFSNFTNSIGTKVATTGDIVSIFVEFSYPVIVIGIPVVLLNVSTIDQSHSDKALAIPMYSYSDNLLLFQYIVSPGQEAYPLNYISTSSLKLDMNSRIYLASSSLSYSVNLQLPVLSSNLSLSNSLISIYANKPPLLDNVSVNVPPGNYGNNNLIIFNFTFSGIVFIKQYDLNFIDTLVVTPINIILTYLNGSGTNSLLFQYIVNEPNYIIKSINQTLFFTLQNGMFYDRYRNSWRNLTYSHFETLSGFKIDTYPPVVEYVDCKNDDGSYFPGDVLDVFIVFNKNVYIHGPGILMLEMFIPHEGMSSNLAIYSSGNMTNILHFTFLVPLPNTLESKEEVVKLDYAGVNALSNHLNGSMIYQWSISNTDEQNYSSIVDLSLPTLDHSHLFFHRNIYLHIVMTTVKEIYYVNGNGTFTAGDTITIAVEFTRPVMIFIPPVLRLNTAGIANNSALYIHGNASRTLFFAYFVQVGDSSLCLDYIDTRYSPYDASSYQVSYALNTDVRPNSISSDRLQNRLGFPRYDDIIFQPTMFGGIFAITIIPGILFPVSTQLPIPGELGSLSFSNLVVIDTSVAYITQVYTVISNKTIGIPISNITIIVEFSAPIVVNGCPKLRFLIGNVFRYASFIHGNISDSLWFSLPIYPNDYVENLDYFDTQSFLFDGCGHTQDSSTFYVKRYSTHPIIDANITLPPVGYRETIISPTSISSGNDDIFISSKSFIQLISTDAVAQSMIGPGDTINILLTYSDLVSIPYSASIQLKDIDTCCYYQYYNNTSKTFVFPYSVKWNDLTNSLTYNDEYSLATDSGCAIKSHQNNYCVAQNLPTPYSNNDLLSTKSIQVNTLVPEIDAIEFMKTDIFFGEDNPCVDIYYRPLAKGYVKEYDSKLCLDSLFPITCNSNGFSWYFNEFIDKVNFQRIIISTGCPNHICNSFKASHLAIPNKLSFTIPLKPVLLRKEDAIPLDSSGIYGVAFNGVSFRSICGNDVDSCNISSFTSTSDLDECGGIADMQGTYSYLTSPICLLSKVQSSKSKHSPQIGWAIDGFPIYGPFSSQGREILPCALNQSDKSFCLDKCNGYEGVLPEVDSYLYRYYLPRPPKLGHCLNINCTDTLTLENPCCIWTNSNSEFSLISNSISCFRGCPINSFWDCSYQHKVKNGSNDYDIKVISQSPLNNSESFSPSLVWDKILLSGATSDTIYYSGSIVRIRVSFTIPIIVEGTPGLILKFNNQSIIALYSSQYNESVLFFDYNITSNSPNGSILCTEESRIETFGGRILRLANFLPIISASLELGKFCYGNDKESSKMIAHVNYRVPQVERVFTISQGTFSVGDSIDIFVEFDTPVTVIGDLGLILDLRGILDDGLSAIASYRYKYDAKTLLFTYVISYFDGTASLDYLNTNSLVVLLNSNPNAGIVLRGSEIRVDAQLVLPRRGSNQSLGRNSNIIIDRYQVKIDSIVSNRQDVVITAGDDIIVNVTFSSCALLTSLIKSVNSINLPIAIVNSSTSSLRLMSFLYKSSLVMIQFSYNVNLKDNSGNLQLFGNSLLLSSNSKLVSCNDGKNVSLVLPKRYISTRISIIDMTIPHVVQTFISNITNGKYYGAGELFDIFIEFDLPVIAMMNRDSPKPLLQLSSLNTSREYFASFVNDQHPNSTLLHFQFIVPPGFSALPVEYAGVGALSGDIRRYATPNPMILANLELPQPFSNGSLSYCCNVLIAEQSIPFIRYLMPLKPPGVYGLNTTIIILMRFSMSVQVIGTPLLELQTGTNTSSFAKYLPNSYSIHHNLPIDILDSDVLFEYIVQLEDNIKSLHHTNKNSVILSSSTRIVYRNVNGLMLDVDCSLREPNDFTPISDRVDRQWLYRFPANVELILKDLYHSEPKSISIFLQHQSSSASVIQQNSLIDKTFGHMYPQSQLSNNETILDKDTGIGYTYYFADMFSINNALKGLATQSSTTASAFLAIDDNVDPLFHDGSVSCTDSGNQSWWQLQLPDNTLIASIQIFPRKQEEWISTIISFTIKGLDRYPEGSFRLNISHFSINSSIYAITSILSYDATAVDVFRAFTLIQDIGYVTVNRTQLPICGVFSNTGCGDGVEHGYGYTWTITFQTVYSSSISLTIIDKMFTGSPMNSIEAVLVTHVDVVRKGYFINVVSTSEGLQPNQWLTPFYIMLLNTTSLPPTNLSDALDVAIWTSRFDTIGNIMQIVLPIPLVAKYIRIQREDAGILSLAEVKVFSDKISSLSSYSGGSPIPPTSLMNPFQPEEPFITTFNKYVYDGRWSIEIHQESLCQPSNNEKILGYSGAFGTISEAILVITDYMGNVKFYYQDLSARVTSLPKHGNLYKLKQVDSHNWMSFFDSSIDGKLLPKPGGEMKLGLCYTNDCIENNGVFPNLDEYRVFGDTASFNYIVKDRLVTYQPTNQFLGSDYFTYEIYDGVTIQRHSTQDNSITSTNEVTLHIRYCRIFGTELKRNVSKPIHPLCNCGITNSTNIQNLCIKSQKLICDNQNNRPFFLSMCQGCESSVSGFQGKACRQQGLKAASYLNSIGLCSGKPMMDCSTEIITVDGKDRRNYLSLKPPTLEGSISAAGDLIGINGNL